MSNYNYASLTGILSVARLTDAVIESKSITENGTYTAPSGVDGYSPITVNVPQPQPVIESKSITENGTYTAPSGVDGYSPITVNVPQPQPVTPRPLKISWRFFCERSKNEENFC